MICDFRLSRPLEPGEDPEKTKQAMGRTLMEAITTGMVKGHRVMKSMQVDPLSVAFMGRYYSHDIHEFASPSRNSQDTVTPHTWTLLFSAISDVILTHFKTLQG